MGKLKLGEITELTQRVKILEDTEVLKVSDGSVGNSDVEIIEDTISSNTTNSNNTGSNETLHPDGEAGDAIVNDDSEPAIVDDGTAI